MKRKTCLVCFSDNISQIIQLGMHPFADSFIDKIRYGESEKVYPLNCMLCKDCGHVQTQYKTNPDDRYTDYEYSYTSSNSSFSKNHWVQFVEELFSKKIINKKKSKVVEVGSNDGFIGQLLKDKNIDYLGVDASPFMASIAKKNNIETIVGLFGPKIINKIKNKIGDVDLLIANNVLNHADNLIEFIESVKKTISPNGMFVFEVPYWLLDFQNNKFDKIYHEHVSYFTLRSLKKLLKNSKLYINKFEIIKYHGGSLRVFVTKEKKSELNNINNFIKKEIQTNVFNEKNYKNFMKIILNKRNNFLKKIYKIKSKGNKVVAIGAAARGNTILNFLNLDSSIIDYVTDISPLKLNKYTPLTRIEIKKDSILSKYEKVYALPLTDNIPASLRSILIKINNNIKFLTL